MHEWQLLKMDLTFATAPLRLAILTEPQCTTEQLSFQLTQLQDKPYRERKPRFEKKLTAGSASSVVKRLRHAAAFTAGNTRPMASA
jgi:hypothetical protein